MDEEWECSYCGGAVAWENVRTAFVHVTTAQRVTAAGPGDYVTDRHNRAGTIVNAVDIIERKH